MPSKLPSFTTSASFWETAAPASGTGFNDEHLTCPQALAECGRNADSHVGCLGECGCRTDAGSGAGSSENSPDEDRQSLTRHPCRITIAGHGGVGLGARSQRGPMVFIGRHRPAAGSALGSGAWGISFPGRSVWRADGSSSTVPRLDRRCIVRALPRADRLPLGSAPCPVRRRDAAHRDGQAAEVQDARADDGKVGAGC